MRPLRTKHSERLLRELFALFAMIFAGPLRTVSSAVLSLCYRRRNRASCRRENLHQPNHFGYTLPYTRQLGVAAAMVALSRRLPIQAKWSGISKYLSWTVDTCLESVGIVSFGPSMFPSRPRGTDTSCRAKTRQLFFPHYSNPLHEARCFILSGCGATDASRGLSMRVMALLPVGVRAEVRVPPT